MNRLWVRLTLAFMLITLLTVTAVGWLADQRADAEFRRYLLQPGAITRNVGVDRFAEYYAKQNSWEGVGDFAATLTTTLQQRRRGFGALMSRMMNRASPLLLANRDGVIIYDPQTQRTQDRLSNDEIQRALPIAVNTEIVGYLLAAPGMEMMLGQAEQTFLQQLRRWLIAATVAIGGVGILLGLAVSRTLAAPLAALATAARGLAKRDWSQRVVLAGGANIVEISEVAQAFNAMAESLEQAEMQRRNLVADVAHELRTPITVLQGNLRAMLDGVYPLELKEIATLYDETRLLARLVDDLRELALAEAGQLSLNLQALDLSSLLQTTTEKFASVADAHQVTLTFRSAEPLLPVWADQERTLQILHNLISNGLRHTPTAGRIELSATRADKFVRVNVSDSGEGIAAEEARHIFERFYRTDQSRTRRSGGSGLGLTIAKTWVETMGGQIGVESTVGQGSRFWFTLPLA